MVGPQVQGYAVTDGQGTHTSQADAERIKKAQRIVPFLHTLFSYPRFRRLYPPGHRRISALLSELEHLLKVALGERVDPLVLTIEGNQFYVEEAALQTHSDNVRELALALSRRRISILRLYPGLTTPELRLLGRLLETDHREILRIGGPEVFLRQHNHPHVEIVAFEEGELEEGLVNAPIAGGDTTDLGLPAELVPTFEAILTAADTQARLERLRSRVKSLREKGETTTAEVDVIQQVLRALVRGIDVSRFDADRLHEVIHHFLDLLENRLDTSADELPVVVQSSEERVAKLLAFALQLPKGERAPELLQKVSYLKDLLRPRGTGGSGGTLESAADQDPNTTFQMDEFDAVDVAALTAIEFNAREFQSQLDVFPVEDTFLLIVCQLMLDADDAQHYKIQRNYLIRALASKARDFGATGRVLLYMTRLMPASEFETRESLLHDCLSALSHKKGVASFFERLINRPDEVTLALNSILQGDSPFGMLAGMLMSEPLSELHERVEAGFLESARRIPGPFRDWCRSDHAALFHEAIFRVFLRLDLRTLKPVTNELLQNGTASQRRQLVKAFSQDGSPKALELLLAVLSDAPRTAGRDDRNVDIVEALGGFRHSKAVEAVSNVIESNNKASCNKALATAAIKALARMQTREAREALRKVAEERRWLRYRYRPQLRTLAVQIMLREEGLR